MKIVWRIEITAKSLTISSREYHSNEALQFFVANIQITIWIIRKNLLHCEIVDSATKNALPRMRNRNRDETSIDVYWKKKQLESETETKAIFISFEHLCFYALTTCIYFVILFSGLFCESQIENTRFLLMLQIAIFTHRITWKTYTPHFRLSE